MKRFFSLFICLLLITLVACDGKITNVDGDNILLAEFKRKPPLTYKEASERIKKIFNIAISESATRAYLNKHKIYTKRSKKIIKITNNYSNKQNDRN